MKNSSAPAFPQSVQRSVESGLCGLTKREYFAAHALQGCMANASGIDRIWSHMKKSFPEMPLEELSKHAEEYLAIQSVHLADELLAALEAQKVMDAT